MQIMSHRRYPEVFHFPGLACVRKRMRQPVRIAVTLQRPDLAVPPATVLLSINQYGQPPALLHDPIDISGTKVHGMWLVQDRSQALLAAYDFLEPGT
jgi:hypothetical protein